VDVGLCKFPFEFYPQIPAKQMKQAMRSSLIFGKPKDFYSYISMYNHATRNIKKKYFALPPIRYYPNGRGIY